MAGQWQGGQWQQEPGVQPHVQPNVQFPQFTGSPGQYGQQQYPGQYPQPPQSPYPPPRYGAPPRRRKPHRGLRIFAWSSVAILALIVLIIALSPKNGSGTPPAAASSSAPPAASQQAAPPASTVAAAAQTVTYEVTGSPADVTYGPAGTELSGTVPMSVSKPLGTPIYYAVSAQLQGSGTVSCKIKVDGKVISASTASGGYNIAQCEISQDPLSGAWQDTNG
jgi:hypothetical protein